jgi:Leucine-rich repeat (LRR) protein
MFQSTMANAGASAGSVHADILTCTNNASVTGYIWSTVPWTGLNPKKFDFDGTFVGVTPDPSNTTSSYASAVYKFNSAPANMKLLAGTGNQTIYNFALDSQEIGAGSKVDVSSLANLVNLQMYGPNSISTINGFEDKAMQTINWNNLPSLAGTSTTPPDVRMSNGGSSLYNLIAFNCNIQGTLPNNKNYPLLQIYDFSYNPNLSSPASWSITAPNLQSLFIENSNFTSIPSLPSTTTSLNVIQAYYNTTPRGGTITSMPAITQFPNLQTIYIHNNKLAGAVPTMNTLKFLQSFYADGNQFTSLPVGYWTGCKSIQNINLSNNYINK